jgi:hypothetical protein
VEVPSAIGSVGLVSSGVYNSTRLRGRTDWMSIFGHKRVLGAMCLGNLSSLRKRDWLCSISLGIPTTSVRSGSILHLVKDTLLDAMTVGHVVPIEFHDIQNLSEYRVRPRSRIVKRRDDIRLEGSFPVPRE